MEGPETHGSDHSDHDADEARVLDDVSPETRLAFEAVYDAAFLTVLRATPTDRPAQGPLLVVFGSYRTKTQPPEFRRTVGALGRPALFIMEHDFGFYATQERVDRLAPMIAAEMERTETTRIDTLGFSIGAYGALAWGAHVPVRHAMAFAPRFSPDPAIIRDPRDRHKMRAHSGTLAFPTLQRGLERIERATILHGLRGPDRLHLRHFRPMGHVDHWVAPDADHFVADWLRRQGRLGPVVEAALDGDRAGVRQQMAQLKVMNLHSLPVQLLLRARALLRLDTPERVRDRR